MAMLIPYLKPSLACREQLLNEVVLPMLSSPPTGWRQRVMITLGQALGCDDPRFFRLVFDKLLAHHRDESDNAWKMELYERCLTYAYVVCYIIQWQPPHPKFIIEQDHLNQWYSETINHLPEHSVLLTASEFLALPDDPRVWPAIRARLLDKIRLNETENRAAIEAIMASANLPLGKSQPSMDSAIASELLAILLRHHPAPDVALATRIVASFPMEFDVPYFSLFGELARLAPGRVDLLVQAVQNGQCRSYDPNYRYGLFSNNLPDTWTMDDRLALLRQLLPMTVSEDPAWREKGWILGLCRSLRLPLPDEARRALVTQYPALVAP